MWGGERIRAPEPVGGEGAVVAYVVELTAPRQVGLREYGDPSPGPGEVLVRTRYSGISAGTELTSYRGTNPYLAARWDPAQHLFVPGGTTVSYPLDTWGYSEVGDVLAVGPGVAEPAIGQSVWGIWGHRSHAVLPADRLAGHALPGDVDPVLATFDRVGAVALNAVLASGARVGETVVVFGQGVIGLLATQLLRAQGSEVVAVDTLPHRLELAATCGAVPVSATDGDVALVIADHLGPAGPDRVIELTGAYPALHQAIRVAGPSGVVIAAGFYQGPAEALRLGEEFHHNQVTLISSQIGALPAELSRRWTRDRLHRVVIDLITAGRIDPRPLISHVLPAARAAEAYRLLDTAPGDALQVILDFGAGAL